MDILKELHFTSDTWEVILPFALMGLDILTGTVYAFINKCFQSSKMRAGLGKKVGEIVIIVIGELFSYGAGLPDYIINGVILYIVFMEFMSILENLDKLGVPIPKNIKKALNNISEDDIQKVVEKLKETKENE